MVVYLYEANKPPTSSHLIKDDPRTVRLPQLLEGLRHTTWYKQATPLEKETITKSLKDHFRADQTQIFGKAYDAVADSFGKAVRADDKQNRRYNNQGLVLNMAYTLLSEALRYPSKNL